MPRHLTLNINELRAAFLFASRDEVRYMLNGVLVELDPGRSPRLVTTDGKRLAIIQTTLAPQEKSGRVFLPAEVLEQTFKMSKKGEVTYKISHNRVHITFPHLTRSMLVKAECHGTQFPKYLQVIPPRRTVPDNARRDFAMNPDYIADYGAAAELLRPKTTHAISIWSEDEHEPIIITLTGIPEFFSVLMPVRRSDDGAKIPDWLVPDIEKHLQENREKNKPTTTEPPAEPPTTAKE